MHRCYQFLLVTFCLVASHSSDQLGKIRYLFGKFPLPIFYYSKVQENSLFLPLLLSFLRVIQKKFLLNKHFASRCVNRHFHNTHSGLNLNFLKYGLTSVAAAKHPAGLTARRHASELFILDRLLTFNCIR